MQYNTTQEWLYRYKTLGYSFFNTNCSEKKVFTKWEHYQNNKPTDDEVARWLNSPHQNYAIVCGKISNLVVFDVDTKNGGDPTPFLNRGMFEMRTPSGGYHFYTTYDPILESTKHKKSEHKGILFAVDVQSNKSLVFAPPTVFQNGGYTITNDVPVGALPDDLMVQVVDALEPEKEAVEYTPYVPPQNVLNRRPGDIFNALASWDDVLIPLGWRKVGRQCGDGTQYWRRPGKTDGISASTNYKGWDLFFPYTKYYSDILEWKKGYTKFNLYAQLNHNGDYRAASKALVYDNYKYAQKNI